MSAKSSTHSNLHSNCRHGPRNKEPDPELSNKVKKCCKVKLCAEKSLEDVSPRLSSIMDVMKDRDCSCEVMARAVRSHLHMNLGLTDRREDINSIHTAPNDVNQTKRPSQSSQLPPTK